MSKNLIQAITELGDHLEKLKIQDGMNTVLARGDVTQCVEMEDAIGCWGWIELNEDTGIGYKIPGNHGIQFLKTINSGSSSRVIFWGELNGNPAEVIVGYWMIS